VKKISRSTAGFILTYLWAEKTVNRSSKLFFLFRTVPDIANLMIFRNSDENAGNNGKKRK
jgi:hypothetical protein